MTELPTPFTVDGLRDDELLRELCNRLEFVGARSRALPNNPTLELAIGHIQIIHSELGRRGVDCRLSVNELGKSRCWEIDSFFADCLSFPERVPYVREADGIRLAFRCRMCRIAEHPLGPRIFDFCEGCMERVLTAVRHRTGCKGIFIFRTFSPECRCAHADGETVLACELFTDNIVGFCETCIRDEIERRHAG